MIFDRLFPSTALSCGRKKGVDPLKISLFFRKYKTLIVVLLLSLISLVFLFSSAEENDKKGGDVADFYEYTALLRSELEETLSSLAGVGKCTVFLTFSDSGETVYAYDEDYSFSEDGRSSGNRKYVLLSSRTDGLVLKIYVPSVAGVAVICEGGDSARVKSDVTEILSGTLGISADRISVKKRNVRE